MLPDIVVGAGDTAGNKMYRFFVLIGASILERGVRYKKKRKEQNKITLENDK